MADRTPHNPQQNQKDDKPPAQVVNVKPVRVAEKVK